jgi:spore maturation protein SpmA
MTIALPLAGVMALWLGLMKIAEKSGLVNILARALRPLLRWLFPDVPASHPAMGSMVMNMAANMLGLSNAATPLGLRAMQDLEKLKKIQSLIGADRLVLLTRHRENTTAGATWITNLRGYLHAAEEAS